MNRQITRIQCAIAEQRWIDQRLAEGLDAPALALIDYRQPCVIYGRRGGDALASRQRAAALGYQVQQRRSGGGAVLAGPWMLGVNLLLPSTSPFAALNPLEAFRWFGDMWRQALDGIGTPLVLATPATFHRHQPLVQEGSLDWVCFAGISHGELLDAQGRKVLGLAQSRGRWGALLSAGLLIGPTPWEQLEYIHTGQRPDASLIHRVTAPFAPDFNAPNRQRLSERLCRQLQPALTGQ